MKRVEYMMTLIDKWGDAMDVGNYFEGRGAKARAMKELANYELFPRDEAGEGDPVAALIEKRYWFGEDEDDLEPCTPDEYETIAVRGDEQALKEGCWIKEER